MYIGKATSLRNRVRSYFDGKVGEKRGPLIEEMVKLEPKIKFQKTDSVLEALLLEAELIKKHNPRFNVKGKDQRTWNYIVITKEEFPRVLIMRQKNLEALTSPASRGSRDLSPDEVFGPFPYSSELRTALKIIRKIFPFRDRCIPSPDQGEARPLRVAEQVGRGRVGCFNYQIGLCPGICVGKISKKEYSNILKNIRMILSGKMKKLVKKLETEMKALAKKRKFEEANKIKKQVFALEHINDVALLKSANLQTTNYNLQTFRIEAYDVSHISGTNIVGVMVVVEGGEAKKSDYRKFKIKGQKGSDDTRALQEILERRLKHTEWPYPNLLVVDGGIAQINTAKNILKDVPIVGVVKDDKHKPKKILGKFSKELEKQILLANSEAHRFAIKYHRSLRTI